MDLKTLEYFLSVARHLNFTRAADECYISQAAISQQINKLERELGFPLFRRSNRSVELTPAGQAFAKSGEELLSDYRAAVSNARKLAVGQAERVNIGIFSQYGYGVYAEVLSVYRKRYPNVKTDFRYVSRQEVEGLLQNGEIDMVLGPYWEYSKAKKLQVTRLLSDPAHMVVRRDDPLAKGIESPEEILEKDFIIFAEKIAPNMYKQIQENCRNYGFEPRFVVTDETFFDKILLMVEAGQGIAMIPSRLGRRLNDDLCIVDLPGSKMKYDLAVIRLNQPEEGAAEQFYQTLTEYFQPPR